MEEYSKSEIALKEGFLTKRGSLFKSWKQRWFVLKVGKLSYYRKKEDTTPARTIDLASCEIDEYKEDPKKACASHPYGFTITKRNGKQENQRTYLSAVTPQLRDEWINLLRIFCSLDFSNSSMSPIEPERIGENEQKLDALLNDLKSTPTSEARENLIRSTSGNYFFTCKEIECILGSIEVESEKPRLLKILISQISDPEHYNIVVQYFQDLDQLNMSQEIYNRVFLEGMERNTQHFTI